MSNQVISGTHTSRPERAADDGGSGRAALVAGLRRSRAATLLREIEHLYRGDAERLRRSIRAYAGCPVIADDAVAEAFAQLIRRGEAVRDPKAWLWRSAFRIAGGLLQERGRYAGGEVPDRATHDIEPMFDLMSCLGELSPSQRAAIVLHDYAGFRASDVATVIGSTEAAVRVHLMRARRRLRVLIDLS